MSEDLRETQRIIDAEQKKLEDMKEEISKREGKESSSEAGIADPYSKQQQADTVQSAQITASEAAAELEKAQAGVVAEFPGIVTKIATVSTSKDATKGGGLLEGATVAEGTELFTIESNKQVKVASKSPNMTCPKSKSARRWMLPLQEKNMKARFPKSIKWPLPIPRERL